MPKEKPDAKTIISLKNVVHKSIDSETDYKRILREQQLKLLRIQRRLSEQKRAVLVVFEGPDAAGKGGVIKRIGERLDPRLLRVYSIVKPTAEEASHHYLWRFWHRLPPYGKIAIFDRSWYGRVLVERVEKFATAQEWKRAYGEINAFEKSLIDDRAVIVKFYIHISKNEQLLRFKSRMADPYKHWKINDEDWRNRKKWNQHNVAADEMFVRTSTELAPWHVIGANYKWEARIEVVKTLVKRLEQADI